MSKVCKKRPEAGAEIHASPVPFNQSSFLAASGGSRHLLRILISLRQGQLEFCEHVAVVDWGAILHTGNRDAARIRAAEHLAREFARLLSKGNVIKAFGG